MGFFRKTITFALIAWAIYVQADGYKWNTAAPKQKKKMVWAHTVGWNFNFHDRYDGAAVVPEKYLTTYRDRSLLGKWAHSDAGAYGNTRKYIDSAMKYGVDGFCIDIIFANAYNSGMRRYYQAAEGTDFKIALCIDSFKGTDRMTKYLGEFLRNWRNHPNNYFIDGKPVVFIYNPSGGMKNDQWKKVFDNLKKEGLEAHYIAQVERENSRRISEDTMKRSLELFGGIYDFGINGYPIKTMQSRLQHFKDSLAKFRRNGILCGGITPGYMGTYTGFYRPFLNFGTVRDNWQAVRNVGCEWVCLTTWNDYVENTQFEPSFWNRDALTRINRDYAALWKGEQLPRRREQVYLAYQNEIRAGDDWTIELLSMPYSEGKYVCDIKLTDITGKKTLMLYKNMKLPKDREISYTRRIKNAMAKLPHIFRVWSRTRLVGGNGKENWKHLAPVVIRPGIVLCPRTVKIYLNDVLYKSASLGLKNGKLSMKIYKSWSIAGKVDFLLNNLNIDNVDIFHKGPPPARANIAKPQVVRQPQDIYTAVYTNGNGQIFWSNPVVVNNMKSKAGKRVVQVPVCNRDFDEDWPLWYHKKFTYSLKNITFNRSEVYDLIVPMDEGGNALTLKTGDWFIPLLRGGYMGRNWYKKEFQPTWKTGTVSGKSRNYLYFDGKDDRLSMPQWTMPIGAFSLIMEVNPEASGKKQCLFNSGNNALKVTIEPDMSVLVVRDNATDSRNFVKLASSIKLPVNKWSKVAVTYDGKEMRLYINSKLVGKQTMRIGLFRVNAVPIIGGRVIDLRSVLKEQFQGGMSGFRLTVGALPEKELFVK